MKTKFKYNILSSTSRVLLFIFVYGLFSNISSEDEPKTGRISYDNISAYESLFLSRSVTTYPSIKLGENLVYRLELEEPSDMEEARKKIGETPEIMKSRKEELYNKLKNDTRLRVPLENDAWLIRFLRSREYNVSLTYDLIKNYYEFRAKNRAEIFDGLLPSGEKDMFEQEVITILPVRDQNKSRIMLIRTNKWNPEAFPFTRIFRMLILLLELGVYEPATQLSPLQIIFDVQGLSRQQVFNISRHFADKLREWTVNCIPIHIRKVHIINSGFIFKFAYNFFKPWLPLDLQRRIVVHRDLNSLREEISASALPDIYTDGQSYPMFTIRSEEWDVLLKYQDQEYTVIDSEYGVIDTNEMMDLDVEDNQGLITESITASQSIEVY